MKHSKSRRRKDGRRRDPATSCRGVRRRCSGRPLRGKRVSASLHLFLRSVFQPGVGERFAANRPRTHLRRSSLPPEWHTVHRQSSPSSCHSLRSTFVAGRGDRFAAVRPSDQIGRSLDPFEAATVHRSTFRGEASKERRTTRRPLDQLTRSASPLASSTVHRSFLPPA